MSVQWKYDVLFNMQVKGPDVIKSDDFSFLPSPLCLKLLKKHHLIFKQSENGAYVACEKAIEGEIKEPIFPVKSLTSFIFLLQINRVELLSGLAPFHLKAEELPEKFGRKHVLYFNNLKGSIDAHTFQPGAEPQKSIQFVASKNATVGLDDLASTVPNTFTYRRKASINQITVTPIHPVGNNSISYALSDEKPTVELNLDSGAYQFEQSGGPISKQVLFASSELLSKPVLGVVQIFKDQSIDYNKRFNYTITFEKP